MVVRTLSLTTKRQVNLAQFLTLSHLALSRLVHCNFKVSFRAKKGESTLDEVRLELIKPSYYPRLIAALNDKYGTGEEIESEKNDIIRNYVTWNTEVDLITLIHVVIAVLGNEMVYLDYTMSLAELDL